MFLSFCDRRRPGGDLIVDTKLNDALYSELCFKMAIISSLLLVEGYVLTLHNLFITVNAHVRVLFI